MANGALMCCRDNYLLQLYTCSCVFQYKGELRLSLDTRDRDRLANGTP